jgi:hypothetical protein
MYDQTPADISLPAQVNNTENVGRECHIIPDASLLKNIGRRISDAMKKSLKVRCTRKFI